MAQSTAMQINWFQMLVRGVEVLGFCTMTAVLTLLIWPQVAYRYHLVLVVCIGSLCWLSMEFGRMLIPKKHRYLTPYGEYGLPNDWRVLALITVAGSVAGFLGGKSLGLWLLGDVGGPVIDPSWRDLALMLLITVLGTAAGVVYLRIAARQVTLENKTTAAERDAARARLMLLQSQLEPHMLFNTLANLHALIETDPAAAQHMLDHLDGFLRASLSGSRATAHPLATEFERLRDYLMLMSIRMGPRLTWTLHLPDELRVRLVPPLLLQPLVENAIRHGLEPVAEGGHVEVSAAQEGNTLTLTVRDTGAGFDTAWPMTGEHFGMTQVRERVASAYGGEGRVDVQSRPGHGTTIRMTLPLQQDIPA